VGAWQDAPGKRQRHILPRCQTPPNDAAILYHNSANRQVGKDVDSP
jgi:hypothetical protein